MYKILNYLNIDINKYKNHILVLHYYENQLKNINLILNIFKKNGLIIHPNAQYFPSSSEELFSEVLINSYKKVKKIEDIYSQQSYMKSHIYINKNGDILNISNKNINRFIRREKINKIKKT